MSKHLVREAELPGWLSPASVWDWSSNLGKDGLWRHRC